MFPRAQQHCVGHTIPATIVTLEEETIASESEMERALNYIRAQKIDLIRGDLVLFESALGYRNNGVTIFNGTKIMDLYSEVDDYGSLPPEFRVIEDGVSIRYWHPIDGTGVGIDHNYIVWFNHRLVQDECVRNLQYGTVSNDIYAIFTSFYYNKMTFTIIFDYTDVLYDSVNRDTYKFNDPTKVQQVLEIAKKSLQNTNMIVFHCESESYPDMDRERTLFVELL